MIVQPERIKNVVKQYSEYSLPTATETLSGSLVQYKGIDTINYKNGYFYKCVEVDTAPGTYTWQQVDVQPTPSGLPDQTGNAGKFLKTDGTTAAWEIPTTITFRTWEANE